MRSLRILRSLGLVITPTVLYLEKRKPIQAKSGLVNNCYFRRKGFITCYANPLFQNFSPSFSLYRWPLFTFTNFICQNFICILDVYRNFYQYFIRLFIRFFLFFPAFCWNFIFIIFLKSILEFPLQLCIM